MTTRSSVVMVRAAICGAALALLSPGAHAAVADPSPLWDTVSHPAPGGEHRHALTVHLNAVDARSSHDVWSVGYRGRGSFETLARHWDGHRWKRVDTPNVADSASSYLTAVAVVSADDVWAVGTNYGPHSGAGLDNLAEHWDGSAWSIVDVPQPGGEFDTLESVSAISPTYVIASGRTCRGESCEIQTLRWDGTSWTMVTDPQLALVQVADAASPTSAWAIGNTAYDDGDPVAFRWNGSEWRQTDLPNPKASAAIVATDVAATTSGAAWITGYAGAPYLLHWTGSEWVHDELAKHPINWVRKVSAASADDAWIIGPQSVPPGGHSAPVTEHWDGDSWSYVSNPARQFAQDATLTDVVAIAQDDAWAVGYVHVRANDTSLIAMHWDGKQWHLVDSPS